MKDEYLRKALVKNVLDGDTVRVEVDLGYNVWVVVDLRLLDVYAYEIKGKEKELGKIDKKKLESLLPLNTEIQIQTFKTKQGKDKKTFDRYVAKIFKETILINNLLTK